MRPVILEPLKDVREKLAALDDWSESAINNAIHDTADAFDINIGKIGQPLRIAVTGGPVSPPIDVTLKLVGRERSLARLDAAIDYITERAQGQKAS